MRRRDFAIGSVARGRSTIGAGAGAGEAGPYCNRHFHRSRRSHGREAPLRYWGRRVLPVNPARRNASANTARNFRRASTM
jgi:hypothetical protein